MVGALGRLRFPVAQSRGRRYPEPPHPYRNEFQRDRDRLVHARAFRRLENKTQVFTPGLSDHFRNRLTHTIEVTQIARTVAAVLGLDEDLTEALALGHDIGHPPFAHAGEAELDRLMRRFGARFDHNLHALRIVENPQVSGGYGPEAGDQGAAALPVRIDDDQAFPDPGGHQGPDEAAELLGGRRLVLVEKLRPTPSGYPRRPTVRRRRPW